MEYVFFFPVSVFLQSKHRKRRPSQRTDKKTTAEQWTCNSSESRGSQGIAVAQNAGETFKYHLRDKDHRPDDLMWTVQVLVAVWRCGFELYLNHRFGSSVGLEWESCRKMPVAVAWKLLGGSSA